MLIKFLYSMVLFPVLLLSHGCLPVVHIDGRFTVDHRVIHSMDQDMEGRKDVSIRRLKIMGLVGERFDGYLGIVVPEVDDAIRQKIEQLNNERLQQYQKIASQTQSTPLREIERQAGSAFIEREKAGFYILTEKGTWKKK